MDPRLAPFSSMDPRLDLLPLHSQNDILSLYLCDTNTDKDVHINDRLVDQGLAIFAMDTEEDEASFDAIQLEPPPAVVWIGLKYSG